MRRSLSFFALVILTGLPALGNTYRGTITLTLTVAYTDDWQGRTPGDPGLSIGDQYLGWYAYDSQTVDGTFYSYPLGYPDHIALWGWVTVPAVINPEGGNQNYLEMYDSGPAWLGVAGGKVTSFHVGGESALGCWDIYPSGWDAYRAFVYTDPPPADMGTHFGGGTVLISDPVLVPDSSPTLWLFLAGCGGLALFRGVGRLSERKAVVIRS